MGGTLSLQAICTVAMMCSTITHVDRIGTSSSYNTIIEGSQFSLVAGQAGVATDLLVMDQDKTTIGNCLTDSTESCTLKEIFTARGPVGSSLGFSVIDQVKKVFGNTDLTVVASVPSQPKISMESGEAIKITASKFASEFGSGLALTGCALFYGLSSSNYESQDAPATFDIKSFPLNSQAFGAGQDESISVKLSALNLYDAQGVSHKVESDQLDFHYICFNANGASAKASLYNVRAGRQANSHKFNVKTVQGDDSSLSAGLSSSSGASDLSSSSETYLSSSSGSSENLSSSTVYVPASSSAASSSASAAGSSAGSVVSSSAAAAVSSSAAAAAASSSSTGTVVVDLPTGTVSLSMTVHLPYTVNASNYDAVTASLKQDIAATVANAVNLTSDAIEPYIIIIGLGNVGSSRRLLQADLSLSFYILGNISNVVTSSSTDISQSQIGYFVATQFVAQVTSGNFVATSSGGVVTDTPTVTVVDTATPSSSSTGVLSTPADNSGSKGLSGGAIAGIVIGTIVGAALLIAGAFYAFYTGACRGGKPAPVTNGNELEARQSSPKNGLPIKTFEEPVAVAPAHFTQPTDFHNDDAENVYTSTNDQNV